jgi:hypothetical protein
MPSLTEPISPRQIGFVTPPPSPQNRYSTSSTASATTTTTTTTNQQVCCCDVFKINIFIVDSSNFVQMNMIPCRYFLNGYCAKGQSCNVAVVILNY